MNVASKDLSQELYELAPSWLPNEYLNGGYRWCNMKDEGGWQLLRLHDTEGVQGGNHGYPERLRKSWFAGLPAYSLGYLLRIMPGGVSLSKLKSRPKMAEAWTCRVNNSNQQPRNHTLYRVAVTPEDAACKLLIELIKQGVISPNGEPTK